MESPSQAIQTPKAAEAFLAFLAMGPGRSLRKLADHLVLQNVYRTSTVAMRSLGIWSSKYRWQDRLAEAATARSTAMLREAADLDADTFLVTSRLLNERAHLTIALDTDHVVKIRESVRKPMPKGSTTVDVTVTVSVEQRKIAERIAASRGLDVDEVLRETNDILGIVS